MSRNELKRYTVIRQSIEGHITGREAAELLSISTRQVYRLKKRILEEGETGVIHKNRGRKPAQSLSEETKHMILELLKGNYQNCNDYHFSALLEEREGIQVSPSTILRIRREANIAPKRKRRPPKAHRPRARRAQEGMLVQIDASPHRWLEDRVEPMSLHAAIDDATGKIVGAVFRQEEDLRGYFLLTKQMIEQHGIPMNLYSDRHTIFRSPNETQTVEQELAGEPVPLSQFGHALDELGIAHIKAMTPQAKGRIERLFQTLQDRWVIELRIRGIQTLEEANHVLPELIKAHNQAFAVKPHEAERAFVSLGKEQSLDLILCYRQQRIIGSGETISFQGKTYKIATTKPKQVIPTKTRVEVCKTLDDRLFISYKGNHYPLQEAEKPKKQMAPRKEKAGSEKKPHKPASNHPWRQYRRPSIKQKVPQTT